MSNTLRKKIEDNKSFIENRTKFWKILVFCLIFCFCFGVLIWIFFSNDFELTKFWINKTKKEKIIVSLLTNFSLLLVIFIFGFSFYFLKFVKEDLIIYSSSFASFIISNNLNSYWLYLDSSLHVALRIIISFAIAFIVMFSNIFLTAIIRNQRLKNEEYWERMISEYREGKNLTNKEIFKIEKIIEYNKLKEKRREAIIAAEQEKEEEKSREYENKIKEIENKLKSKDLSKKQNQKQKQKKAKKKKIKF